MTEDFEKLGAFYLGRLVSPQNDANVSQATSDERPILLYESRDLLTHGVCIGMTGSGKTGLCLGMLEEAAIDSIPVIAIDPKGDLGNLLLTFPQLQGRDFAPWVNEDEAQKDGISKEQLAEQKASEWRRGLESWGQDGARIEKLKNACNFSIYTPGSTAGLPVSILSSLRAPIADILEDGDLLRERVSNVVASLLTLLGIDADPLQSREHILLSTVIDRAWRASRDIDLQRLVAEIQQPSGDRRIGALDIDAFFPKKDRFSFALALNNLLAAPGFEAWMSGYPLDINSLLFSDSGKPQVSIFSIAHLSDTERMFFVSLLLNQIVSWMRTQSGSSSLRAILYMDEIYGYFPPVSNPPSKTPLLTLLKQARAYGLGVLLASQNSVDLDYKGLANAGTWFIGRLQTERDKQRLLDGLEGAVGESGKTFDKRLLSDILGRLKPRNFLLHNIHSEQPEVFETRWTLSYLFGPLGRNQIKLLMSGRDKTPPANKRDALAQINSIDSSKSLLKSSGTDSAHASLSSISLSNSADSISTIAPTLPVTSSVRFLKVVKPLAAGQSLIYRAAIYATAILRFTDTKAKLDTTSKKSFIVPVQDTTPFVNLEEICAFSLSIDQLESAPEVGATYALPPSVISKESNRKAWSKNFLQWVSASQKFYLLKSNTSGQYSNPQESERDFRVRLRDISAVARDESIAKLKDKYAPRLKSLEQKVEKANAAVQTANDSVSLHREQAAISAASSVLGAFMKKNPFSSTGLGKVQSAAREMGKANAHEKASQRANESLVKWQEEMQTLDAQFRMEVNELAAKFNPEHEKFEVVSFLPKSTQIMIQIFEPIWVPYTENVNSELEELWR